MLSFEHSLYILETSPMLDMSFFADNIFSPSVACSFILFTGCFMEQKFLIFMKYYLSFLTIMGHALLSSLRFFCLPLELNYFPLCSLYKFYRLMRYILIFVCFHFSFCLRDFNILIPFFLSPLSKFCTFVKNRLSIFLS